MKPRSATPRAGGLPPERGSQRDQGVPRSGLGSMGQSATPLRRAAFAQSTLPPPRFAHLARPPWRRMRLRPRARASPDLGWCRDVRHVTYEWGVREQVFRSVVSPGAGAEDRRRTRTVRGAFASHGSPFPTDARWRVADHDVLGLHPPHRHPRGGADLGHRVAEAAQPRINAVAGRTWVDERSTAGSRTSLRNDGAFLPRPHTVVAPNILGFIVFSEVKS